MSFLFDGPTPLDDLTLGTVLHVGAGAGGVLETYDGLRWERLILVEGDPDTLVELQSAVGARPDVEVIGQAVAPRAGPLDWHRYNLSSLNGPWDASDLVQAYPRLRPTGSTVVDATAFDTLLRALAPMPKGPHLLVLDLHGQASAMLACAPGEVLRRFDWIAVRGRSAPSDAAAGNGDAVATLLQQGYVRVELQGETDPLWPMMLLRLDEHAYHLKQMQDEVASLRAARDEMASQLRDLQSAAMDTARHQHETLAAERAAHGEALDELRQQLERQALQAQAAVDAAAARQSELEAELAGVRQALDAESTGHARALASLQQQEQQANAVAAAAATEREQAMADLAAARRELEAARAEHAREVADLEQRRAQLVQDAAREAAGERARFESELASARQAAEVERAAHRKALDDWDLERTRQRLATAEALTAREAELTSALAAVRQQFEAERAAHAATTADLEQQRRQQQAAADAWALKERDVTLKLHVEREGRQADRASHGRTVAELEQKLAQLGQALAAEQSAHAATRSDLQRQAEAAAGATKKVQEQLAEQAKDRQASDARAAERLRAMEDEAHTARQAAALSLKLQTLREADLKDLQGRYQTTLARQQSQHELLTQLAQRLTVANRYFHQLSEAQRLGTTTAAIAKPTAPRKRRSRSKPETPAA